MEQTFGEKLVRVDFNVSGSNQVNEIKKSYAKLIDDANEIRDKASSDRGDIKRWASEAITCLETGCMYAVKAATAP